MITEKNILDNIRKIRISRGYSQEYIASRLDMKQGGYSLIEKGERKLTIDKLLQIAILLDVPLEQIISYPEKKLEKKQEPVKAILQIELQEDKKDQVLKLVFGENNLEILNK